MLLTLSALMLNTREDVGRRAGCEIQNTERERDGSRRDATCECFCVCVCSARFQSSDEKRTQSGYHRTPRPEGMRVFVCACVHVCVSSHLGIWAQNSCCDCYGEQCGEQRKSIYCRIMVRLVRNNLCGVLGGRSIMKVEPYSWILADAGRRACVLMTRSNGKTDSRDIAICHAIIEQCTTNR